MSSIQQQPNLPLNPAEHAAQKAQSPEERAELFKKENKELYHEHKAAYEAYIMSETHQVAFAIIAAIGFVLMATHAAGPLGIGLYYGGAFLASGALLINWLSRRLLIKTQIQWVKNVYEDLNKIGDDNLEGQKAFLDQVVEKFPAGTHKYGLLKTLVSDMEKQVQRKKDKFNQMEGPKDEHTRVEIQNMDALTQHAKEAMENSMTREDKIREAIDQKVRKVSDAIQGVIAPVMRPIDRVVRKMLPKQPITEERS